MNKLAQVEVADGSSLVRGILLFSISLFREIFVSVIPLFRGHSVFVTFFNYINYIFHSIIHSLGNEPY